MNTDVAVVGFAQAPQVHRTSGTTNGVEMLVPVFRELFAASGLTRRDSPVAASSSWNTGTSISTPLVVPEVRRT